MSALCQKQTFCTTVIKYIRLYLISLRRRPYTNPESGASLDAVRASLRRRSPNGLSEPSDAVLLMKIEPHQRHGYFLVPRRQPSESEYARTFDDPMDAFDFEGSAHSHTARSD